MVNEQSNGICGEGAPCHINSDAELETAAKRLVALAGEHADEARALLDAIDDYAEERAQERAESLFRQVGQFLTYRGDVRAWHDLYLRLAGRGGAGEIFVGADEHYAPGQEFAFALGKNWRAFPGVLDATKSLGIGAG